MKQILNLEDLVFSWDRGYCEMMPFSTSLIGKIPILMNVLKNLDKYIVNILRRKLSKL